MVAIEREVGLRREYALLSDAWPAHFSLIICQEGQMRVEQELREVVVAHLDHNLTPTMLRDLTSFLIHYDIAQLQDWCEKTIDRLIVGDLDIEWLQETEFVQKLKQELSIRIVLIFNFTPDNDTRHIKPDESYPLSIVYSRV